MEYKIKILTLLLNNHQRRHALLCYLRAVGVYMGRNWRMAEDHLYFSSARQLYNMNEVEDAFRLFSLACPSRSCPPLPFFL
jgi:hypothetical protein